MGKYFYFFINIIAGVLPLFFILRKRGMFCNFSLKKPQLKHILALSSLIIFIISSPFKQTIDNGQTSNLIFFFTFFSIYLTNHLKKSIFLALAATLKFSLFPIFGIYLLLKKEYKWIIVTLLIFLLITLSPILLGHSIINLYTNYIEAVINSASATNGVNNFLNHGSNMTQFEFFKNNTFNIIGKTVIILLLIPVLLKERRKKTIRLTALLPIFTVTMTILYSRLYNFTIFVMPLLLLFSIEFILKKLWGKAIITSIFTIFFLTPLSIIFKLSAAIGIYFKSSSIILSKFSGIDHIFPTIAVVTYLLAIYSIYIYRHHYD